MKITMTCNGASLRVIVIKGQFEKIFKQKLDFCNDLNAICRTVSLDVDEDINID